MSTNRPLLIGLAVVVGLCLCLACALAVSAYLFLSPQGPIIGPTRGEFAGYYTSGFEVSSFVPCAEAGLAASGEAWWLGATPESDFYNQYVAVIEGANPPLGDYATIFVRFRGAVSTPGEYGHLGAYQREVTAEEVLEMSLDGTC